MLSLITILVLKLILAKCKLDSVQTRITEIRLLKPYKTYSNVQLFHYTIPPQVDLASFHYKAVGNVDCISEVIEVYLQYGSYPIMSLQNFSYPEYILMKRIHLSHVTVQLDLKPVVVNIEQPLPGHWYAAAILKGDESQIKQKGLFKPCFSRLFSSLRLNVIQHAITLLPNSETIQNASSIQLYRMQ
ncbi:hypothetical protein JTE90_005775 [Oedothorax gibbosus]|uniref:Uncharacterized protein n=1 Tax=Oedothorax gibbosus TaxID=931172 RepID=A0AAV6URA2_9ARAC|nr:hypothetical protein JTE90_005775 [Oedothorax gibbosus]